MYTCAMCGNRYEIKCPNCFAIEQNRISLEQNKKDIIDSTILNVQAIKFKMEQDLEIAKLKLEQDLRIANEQNVSLEDARKKGYELFGIEKPVIFENSIDETGKITKCNFQNPYILNHLQEEYTQGFYQRLNEQEIISEEICELFEEKAYKLGKENFKGTYSFGIVWSIFLQVKFRINFVIHPYCILYNNDKKIYELGKVEWLEFKEDYLRDAYIAGALEFIKENNTPLKVNERIIAENKKIQEQTEAEKNKLIEQQKAKEQDRKDNILYGSIFGGGLLLIGVIIYFMLGGLWLLIIIAFIIICLASG